MNDANELIVLNVCPACKTVTPMTPCEAPQGQDRHG